jgi:hypothetical protein
MITYRLPYYNTDHCFGLASRDTALIESLPTFANRGWQWDKGVIPLDHEGKETILTSGRRRLQRWVCETIHHPRFSGWDKDGGCYLSRAMPLKKKVFRSKHTERTQRKKARLPVAQLFVGPIRKLETLEDIFLTFYNEADAIYFRLLAEDEWEKQ